MADVIHHRINLLEPGSSVTWCWLPHSCVCKLAIDHSVRRKSSFQHSHMVVATDAAETRRRRGKSNKLSSSSLRSRCSSSARHFLRKTRVAMCKCLLPPAHPADVRAPLHPRRADRACGASSASVACALRRQSARLVCRFFQPCWCCCHGHDERRRRGYVILHRPHA